MNSEPMTNNHNEIINNRYQILKKLGAGNMGEVFLVEDHLNDGQQKALKKIKKSIVYQKYKHDLNYFKHEFEVMSRLKHPNLIHVYDFGHIASSDTYYITMEYVNGVSLKEHLDSGFTFTNDQLITFMIETCRALAFIHARNILHRDINPNNIMLCPEIKIMDFGLADTAKEDAAKSKGTLLYLAPEVTGGNISYGTDIFSLGLTFYEIIKGYPFYRNLDSRQIITMLHKENDFNVYRKNILNTIENKTFRSLIDKMTVYTPETRYKSCMQIIKDIRTLTRKNIRPETDETKQAYVTGAGFVGRETEFNLLKNMLKTPDIFFLYIHGKAGIGKSRLLYEFKKYCQLNTILFVEGSCYEHQVKLYGPFIEILNVLILMAPDYLIKTFGGQLKKILPDHPTLKNVTQETIEDPKKERTTLIECITGFIIKSADSTKKQIVLHINDLHWADAATLNIIEELVILKTKDDIGAHSLRLIANSRKECNACFENLNSLKNHKMLSLKPFDQENVRHYINAIFGANQITDKLANAVPYINRKVGGNPFFLQVLIKSMVEHNVITRTDILWDLHGEIEQIDIPNDLNQLVIQRLQDLKLNDCEIKLLEVLCLTDRKISSEELNLLSGLKIQCANTLVDYELINKEMHDNNMYFIIAHDLIRENIEKSITDKPEKHARIARILEKLHETDSENYIDELAHHYFEAGNKQKALRYLKESASNAHKNYFNNKAITLYNRMLNLLDEDEINEELEIRFTLSEPYRILGRFDEFLENADRILILAKKTNHKKYLAETYLAVGRRYVFAAQFKTAREYLGKAIAMFEELNDKKGILYSYNYMGCANLEIGTFDKAMEYLKVSLQIAQEIGDQTGISYSTGNMSFVYRHYGEFDKAIEMLNTTLKINLDKKDREGELIVCGNLGNVHYLNGEYDKAAYYFERIEEIGSEIHAYHFIATSAPYKALLILDKGRVDEAEKIIDEAIELLKSLMFHEELHYAMIVKSKIANTKFGPKKALSILENEIQKESHEEYLAELHYEHWKISKNELMRQKALSYYKRFYQLSPTQIYKKKIDTLTKASPTQKQSLHKKRFYG